MWKNVTLCTVVGLLFASVGGCGSADDDRMINVHLVDHFRKNGLDGRYRKLNAESLGAVQGGRYASIPPEQQTGTASDPSEQDPFLLEFAKFDDPKKAQRLEARGFRSQSGDRVYKCYANGPFVMIVRRPPKNKNVVKIFREF